MALSRTTSALWTSFLSCVRHEDLVWVISIGFGMREVCNHVLWAGCTGFEWWQPFVNRYSEQVHQCRLGWVDKACGVVNC